MEYRIDYLLYRMPNSVPSGILCSRIPYRKTAYVICAMYTLNIPHDRCSFKYLLGYPLKHFIEYPVDSDLDKEHQEEPHRFWAGVAV